MTRATRLYPQIATDLYEALKHGDEEHRRWLSEALSAFFNDEPIPPPRNRDGVMKP